MQGKQCALKPRFYKNTVNIFRLKFSSQCLQKYLNCISEFIFIITYLNWTKVSYCIHQKILFNLKKKKKISESSQYLPRMNSTWFRVWDMHNSAAVTALAGGRHHTWRPVGQGQVWQRSSHNAFICLLFQHLFLISKYWSSGINWWRISSIYW